MLLNKSDILKAFLCYKAAIDELNPSCICSYNILVPQEKKNYRKCRSEVNSMSWCACILRRNILMCLAVWLLIF